MQVYYHLAEWRAVRATLPSHLSLGFVPTMGSLHTGHMSLFTKSQCENDLTIASIYVNRAQFNHAEDYERYPRTIEADLELLDKHKVDYCLVPTEDDIYPDHFNYQIHEISSAQSMEGLYRPGHFTGMLTIVMKLLQLAKPSRAYFGEKDYQQYLLIKNMVEAFFLDVDIIACPTIREASGLAYSSRNARLSEEARRCADQFAAIFHQRNLSCEEITNQLVKLGILVDYIEDHLHRRFAAIKIDGVRLIDNISMP